MAIEILRVVFLVAVGAIMIAEYRWVARKSAVLGTIVGLGLVVRLVVGLALFFISYLDLDFLRGLHTGGGFWSLSSDAKLYYTHAASSAVGNDLYWEAIPAPYYVRALAWWLGATGTSVLSAVLFNSVCYMATVAVIVSVRGQRDRQFVSVWLPLILAAFSFSPLLLLTSTQVLKDPLFALVVVIGCRASFEVIEYFAHSSSWRVMPLAVPVGIGAIALGVLGGVREYYGMFLWFSLATGLLALICLGRSAAMRRTLVALLSITVLAVWWIGFMIGVGPQYPYYASLISNTTGNVVAKTIGVNVPTLASSPKRQAESVTGVLRTRRDGFVLAGGATNFATTSIRTTAPRPDQPKWVGALRSVGTGLLAMFVPISLLKATSIVTFQGGKGLLFVTDIDTIFIDVTLLTMVWLMLRHRASVLASLPSVLFALVLVGVSTVLLAYVVTNFGTLFRLRSMISVPAWVLPLALGTKLATQGLRYQPPARPLH